MHDVNLEGTGFALLWTPETIFPKTFCELQFDQNLFVKYASPKSFSKCEVVPKVIADIELTCYQFSCELSIASELDSSSAKDTLVSEHFLIPLWFVAL